MREAAVPPLLVSVMLADWLDWRATEPKLRLEGFGPSEAGVAPEPVKEVCAEAGVPLLVMVNVPLRLPAAVGLKVTRTLQELPAATEPEVMHVPPVTAKSPLVFTPMMVAASAALFVKVALCAEDAVPIVVEPNASEAGDKLTCGAAKPVPLSGAEI